MLHRKNGGQKVVKNFHQENVMQLYFRGGLNCKHLFMKNIYTVKMSVF
jgi:hypothetical protein